MDKIQNGIGATQGIKTGHPLEVSYQGKPCIYLNSHAGIIDYNDEFLNVINVSKNELADKDFILPALNTLFVESVGKAATQELSSFHGIIKLGKNLKAYYMDAALFDTGSSPDKVLLCCVLEINTVSGAIPEPGVSSGLSAAEENGFPDTASLLLSEEGASATHLQLESELNLSKEKYYQLIMNLPVGITLISAGGQLLEINDALKNIMGLPFIAPLSLYNIYKVEAMKRVGIVDQFSKCISTKEVVRGEVKFESHSRHQEVFLSYSFVPIKNQNEEVEAVIGFMNDLTQQKESEIQSHERADFLNLVINSIKTPFFVKDEDHKWVMLNEAAVDMMGKPREELLGKSDYDLYPREQADVFWKYDSLVFENGESSNEEQITWRDGNIHTIITHKQLYVEKPLGKKYIVVTIHDISGYQKIVEELRASEMKYRELFDNANDFIITVDMDGNFTNANRTLLNRIKSDFTFLAGKSIFDFIKQDNWHIINQVKEQLLAGEIRKSFEVEALNVEGKPVVYEVKVSMIIHDNKPAGMQCVFRNVTKRREASLKMEEYNQNLIELHQAKDKFFSIIAHDLRNPYSSLIGFSELLLEDLEVLSTDEIRDYLKIIHNSAKNSLNLLENLLTWSRLQTGRMPFAPSQVGLSKLVDEVTDVLFSLSYRKKIKVNNLIEPDVIIMADRNMLNTILNNLVMNAIKYTPAGGEISIYNSRLFSETAKEPEYIKIFVADTGVGMDADVCSRLFTLNKPVSSPGTEKEQGTGLGLLLAREMVEKHGGNITVESSPGKGSVFSFLIPVYMNQSEITQLT